jgi:hypothetical protein
MMDYISNRDVCIYLSWRSFSHRPPLIPDNHQQQESFESYFRGIAPPLHKTCERTTKLPLKATEERYFSSRISSSFFKY